MSGFLKISGASSVQTTGGSASDGYIAFFTGSNSIAGDNDLFWDRAENKLVIGSTVEIYVDDVDGYTDGYISCSGNRALAIDAQIYPVMASTELPSGTTHNIDWSQGNVHVLDLEAAAGDVTLSFSNGRAGATYIIKVIQDSSVAVNIIWPPECLFAGGAAPTISTAARAIDILSLFYDGALLYVNIAQEYKRT